MNTILALLSSRIGISLAAFAAAWALATWRADLLCEAGKRAAAAVEIQRQSDAAKAIELSSLHRRDDDFTLERGLRAEIQRLRDAQPHVTPRTPCTIDDAFARSVHEFDARAKRPARGAK